MAEPNEEPPYVHDVEVDVVGEVGANVRVRTHQGAVQSGPTYADHHSNQAQQQEDQAGISTHLIYKRETANVSVPKYLRTDGMSSKHAVREVGYTLPWSQPSSGSLKRTLRLEFSLVAMLLGGGRPSSDALLLFRMETKPSGEEF